VPKQLTVHNATITTASVEVKTLTISGKQVTLAVFRQLREEQLIGEDGRLLGEPWGFVNYHPDKCEATDHLHVVWQRGDDLLRSRIDYKAGFESKGDPGHAFWPPEAEWHLASLVREWACGRLDECPVEGEEYTSRAGAKPVRSWPVSKPYGFPVLAEVSVSLGRVISARQSVEAVADMLGEARLRDDDNPLYGTMPRAERIADLERRGVAAEGELRSRLEGLDAELAQYGMDHGQLAAEMNSVIRSEHERRERHRLARKTLAELPQLFIAV
jgi:hypothetical protein